MEKTEKVAVFFEKNYLFNEIIGIFAPLFL